MVLMPTRPIFAGSRIEVTPADQGDEHQRHDQHLMP
jgi:hypothetical protein